MDKKIVLIIGFLFCFASVILAQQGGGPPQGGGERPKFNSKNLAGVFYYDIDDTMEYVKIKDETKDRAVAKALKGYNKEVKKLEFLNTQNFNDIDLLMNLAMSGEVPKGEKPKEAEGKEYLRKVIPTVRKILRKEEEKLNKVMQEIVSEKQYKKWLKYQRVIRKKLLPKRSQPTSSINNKTSGSSFGRGNQLGQQRNGF